MPTSATPTNRPTKPPTEKTCVGYWERCNEHCFKNFIQARPFLENTAEICPLPNETQRSCTDGECRLFEDSDIYTTDGSSQETPNIWLVLFLVCFVLVILGSLATVTKHRVQTLPASASVSPSKLEISTITNPPTSTSNGNRVPPYQRQISLSMSHANAVDKVNIQPMTEEIEFMNRRMSRKLSDELQKEQENSDSTENFIDFTKVMESRKHGESVYHEPDLVEDQYLYLCNPKHRKTPSNSHTRTVSNRETSGTERSRESVESIYDVNFDAAPPQLVHNLSNTCLSNASANSSNRTMETFSSKSKTVETSSQVQENMTQNSSQIPENQSHMMKSLDSVESEGESDSDTGSEGRLRAISPFFLRHQSDSVKRESTYQDCTRPSLLLHPGKSHSKSEKRGSIIAPDSLQEFAQRRRQSLVVKERRRESIRRQSMRQKHKRETRSELAQAMAAARISENHTMGDTGKNRRGSFLGNFLKMGVGNGRRNSLSVSQTKQPKPQPPRQKQNRSGAPQHRGGTPQHRSGTPNRPIPMRSNSSHSSRNKIRPELTNSKNKIRPELVTSISPASSARSDQEDVTSQTDEEIPPPIVSLHGDPTTRSSLESQTSGPTYLSSGLNLRDAALSIKLARAGSSTPRNDEAATKDFILSEHLFPTKNVARRRHTIGVNSVKKQKKHKKKPKFTKTLSRNRESLDCSSDEFRRLQEEAWMLEQSETDIPSEDSDRSYSGIEIFQEAKELDAKSLWGIITRSRYVIERQDVEIDDQEQLGGGRFGKVYQADYNGATVAMKRVNVENQEGFIKECDLFFEVSTHPNICRYFGFSEISNIFYIVMEFFQNGSILHTMQKGHRFTLDEKVNICRQISAGILHLHRKDVIHGDIAARNVLIDVRQMRVAVTDFGFSRKVGDTSKSRYISTRWAAPELTHEFIFTRPSDVYALGVTCMEVLQDGRNPFSGMSNTEVKRKVSSGMTPRIPGHWHFNIQNILHDCFKHRSERLEVKHIYDGWKHYEQHFLTTGFE